MDTLHTAPRPGRRENETRRDHLAVFREFLDHLDRVSRQNADVHTASAQKPNGGGTKR
jgi:hypothetical protein